MAEFRIEKDSLGEVSVPTHALYGAQTQRAVENFHISGMPLPGGFLSSLGLIKAAAARANADLGLLEPTMADGIAAAATSNITISSPWMCSRPARVPALT